jgi:hypothetical protein
MNNIWIIAIALFLIVLFVYWRTSKIYFKNEVFSEGTWNSWSTRLFYWQGAVFASIGVTFLIMYLLMSVSIILDYERNIN